MHPSEPEKTTEAAPTRRPHKTSYWIGRLWLRVFGWELEGTAPAIDKAVIVAAPHTSNWDLPHTLAVAYALDVPISWLGKDSLFRAPFGGFMRWLGGIAVDRSARHNMVQRAAQIIRESDRLFLIIPPEGTRDKGKQWKSGFYYVALEADVPIVLGYLDYRKKRGGMGHVFKPSGDTKADMDAIRAFYANISGKFPELASPIVLSSELAVEAPPGGDPGVTAPSRG